MCSARMAPEKSVPGSSTAEVARSASPANAAATPGGTSCPGVACAEPLARRTRAMPATNADVVRIVKDIAGRLGSWGGQPPAHSVPVQELTRRPRSGVGSEDVELVEGRAAGEGRVAGATIEERLLAGARGAQLSAQLLGRRAVGGAVVADDDAVVRAGALDRDLPPGDVPQHLVDGAVERIAPAAAAGRPDADDGARRQRFGVGQGVDLVLVGPAGVDGDLERPPGL